jgi:hypothetical protein
MVIELKDFIKVYDEVLEQNVCKFLIDLFEKNNDKQERIDNNSLPNFTQFNLTENCNLTAEVNNIHNFLISKVFEYKRKYCEDLDINSLPSDHSFEQFRIKKYNNDGNDLFDTHVDVVNYPSARRFLSFMWYLNNVDDGGETVFDELKIKPKTGSLLIFPPLWLFPHKGNPPISNTKYLLSTYLHYR